MKRWLLIGGGVIAALIVVVIGVLVLVVANLDSVVKAAVERIGPEVTQTEVRLDDVDISARSGTGALRGLFVGNPDGFEMPSVFELGEISVDVDVGSLTSDTVVIREIVIAAPQITYEIGADGSNIDALRRNAAAAVGGNGGDANATSESSGDEPSRKIIIENLYLRDGQISVAASALPGQSLGATLPEIHLTDLGKESGGADPTVIADKVLEAVTAQVGAAVAQVDLSGLLDGVTGEAADQLRGALEGTGAAEAGEALQQGLEGAAEGVKGLLGGN